MANINFYLKKVTNTNKRGEVPIIAQINLNYKKYRKQIEMVDPDYWNKGRQQVDAPKKGKPYNRYIEINSLIDSYYKGARDLFNDCLKNKIELDEYVIKSFFEGKQVIKTKAPKFLDAFDEFIEMKKVERSERTPVGYNTVLNFLKDFQKDMEYPITWNSLDIGFFDKLKVYAFNYRNTADNYFSKIVGTLKNFLKVGK